jgi:hypothetical protein
MSTVLDTLDYKLAKVILSQKKSFTPQDILNDLHKENLNVNEQQLKNFLIEYRNNRIIVQDKLSESYYVSE